MEYQCDDGYSIGTNRINGQVECTPSQPEAEENILSPRVDMATIGMNDIPLESVCEYWTTLRSVDDAELGHFTLLFSRGRQRNVQRVITHVHNHCVAH